MFTNLENCLVVFQSMNVVYKGFVRWYGQINNVFNAFGIETSEIEMGTNGTFNGNRLFICRDNCGVVVRESKNIFKIDEKLGFIVDKRFKDLGKSHRNVMDMKYRMNDVVIVKLKEIIKVGKIGAVGNLNEIFCYGVKFNGDPREMVFVSNDVVGKFTDDNGIVNCKINGIYNIRAEENAYYERIGKRLACEKLSGTLKWKGEIDGFKCIAIDPDDCRQALDCRKYFGSINAFWTFISVDIFKRNNRY